MMDFPLAFSPNILTTSDFKRYAPFFTSISKSTSLNSKEFDLRISDFKLPFVYNVANGLELIFSLKYILFRSRFKFLVTIVSLENS